MYVMLRFVRSPTASPMLGGTRLCLHKHSLPSSPRPNHAKRQGGQQRNGAEPVCLRRALAAEFTVDVAWFAEQNPRTGDLALWRSRRRGASLRGCRRSDTGSRDVAQGAPSHKLHVGHV